MNERNIVVFPQKLRDLANDDEFGKEFVKFHLVQNTSTSDNTGKKDFCPHIHLPMPNNLSFGDNASYGNVSIGKTDATKAFSSRSENLTNADSLLAGMKLIDSLTGGIASDFTNPKLIEQGLAFNNAVTVAFEGNDIRTFSFQYKLVPSNQKESELIASIIHTFRLASYAKKHGSFALEYPIQFNISFKVGGDKDNEYLPKIHTCYMSSMETTYNPDGNIYFKDGAPTAVDLTMTFTETRRLTREDIASSNQVKLNIGSTTLGGF